MNIALLDGYVDEPSVLGVPPYIGPYPRYIYGSIKLAGHKPIYITIDDIRKKSERANSIANSKILVVTGGAIVPGKYLRTMPASIKELEKIVMNFKGIKFLTGPIARFSYTSREKIVREKFATLFDYVIYNDADAVIYDFLTKKGFNDRQRTDAEWAKFSVAGAECVKEHFDYPVPLIVEIETYRGCSRYISGGCSFCTDITYGAPRVRQIDEIVKEVETLYSLGIIFFRLGGQSCFISYMAKGLTEQEYPEPNPDAIKKLFIGIKNVAPKIKVLHLDNANPAVIYRYPVPSREIVKTIVEYCTPGNVLALGLESCDPVVAKANNLNTTPEETLFAIQLFNKYGAERGSNGMPKLLPGINFVYGLTGERKETYESNFAFLKEILSSNLLVRRINIRQVASIRKNFGRLKYPSQFIKFKRKVRQEIDNPMLKKILPVKTILRDIYMELNIGNVTFGRQIGTYPLLVGVPYKTILNRFVDVKITDYGERSVTGVEYPLSLNHTGYRQLCTIPGISKKMAARILRARPINDVESLKKCINDERTVREIMDYFIVD